MPSLASILGEKVLNTSSQSSFNSKKSKTRSSSETQKKRAMDSRAKSITDSQKTRATACSKLMEEAKHIGKALEALCSEFNDMANLFPINTWNNNKAIFTTW